MTPDLAALTAHYQTELYHATVDRVAGDPTHPQHRQLVDLLESVIALDRDRTEETTQ